MKNKKRYIIIGITLILLIVGYLGYKTYILKKYSIDEEMLEIIKEAINIDKTITIKNVKLKENEYLKLDASSLEKDSMPDDIYMNFQNIKIRNDFQDYQKRDSKYNISYVIGNEDEKIQEAILVNIMYSFVDKDVTKEELELDKEFKNINIPKFFKKNNINDDIDMLKYWKTYENKNNIFTSTQTIKTNYYMQTAALYSIPFNNYITLIDGDYKGMIYHLENLKRIHILKNGYQYVFSIINKSLTDEELTEYVIDLISTIVIE